MSFVRVPRRTQSLSARSKRKHKKKKPWDDTTTDLTVHKLSQDELDRRHRVHTSTNLEAVQEELRRRSLKKAKKERSFSEGSGQAGLLREILYDEEQLKSALAHSDRVMSVVKDLFYDDPKRFKSVPQVTRAPGVDGEKRRVGPIAEPSLHTSHLDILSESVMDPHALNDGHDEGEEEEEESEPDDGGEETPVFDSRLDVARFRDYLHTQGTQQQHRQDGGIAKQKADKENIDPATSLGPSSVPPPGRAVNDTVKVKKKMRSRSKGRGQSSVLDVTQKTSPEDLSKCLNELMTACSEFERTRSSEEGDFNQTANTSSGFPKLSGYTAFLVQTLTRVLVYLRENEEHLKREKAEKIRLREEIAQQRELLDAMTVDTIQSQELSVRIQTEARMQINQMEHRLQVVEHLLAHQGFPGDSLEGPSSAKDEQVIEQDQRPSQQPSGPGTIAATSQPTKSSRNMNITQQARSEPSTSGAVHGVATSQTAMGQAAMRGLVSSVSQTSAGQDSLQRSRASMATHPIFVSGHAAAGPTAPAAAGISLQPISTSVYSGTVPATRSQTGATTSVQNVSTQPITSGQVTVASVPVMQSPSAAPLQPTTVYTTGQSDRVLQTSVHVPLLKGENPPHLSQHTIDKLVASSTSRSVEIKDSSAGQVSVQKDQPGRDNRQPNVKMKLFQTNVPTGLPGGDICRSQSMHEVPRNQPAISKYPSEPIFGQSAVDALRSSQTTLSSTLSVPSKPLATSSRISTQDAPSAPSSSHLLPFQPAMLLSPPRQKDRRDFIKPPGYHQPTSDVDGQHPLQRISALPPGSTFQNNTMGQSVTGNMPTFSGPNNTVKDHSEQPESVTALSSDRPSHAYTRDGIPQGIGAGYVPSANRQAKLFPQNEHSVLLNNYTRTDGGQEGAPSILSLESSSTRYLSLPSEHGGPGNVIRNILNPELTQQPQSGRIVPSGQDRLLGQQQQLSVNSGSPLGTAGHEGSMDGSLMMAEAQGPSGSPNGGDLTEKIANLSRQRVEAEARLLQLKNAYGGDINKNAFGSGGNVIRSTMLYGRDDNMAAYQRPTTSGAEATTLRQPVKSSNTGVLIGESPPVSPIVRDLPPQRPVTTGSSHVTSEGRKIHISMPKMNELEISATSTPASKRSSLGSEGPSAGFSQVNWKTPMKDSVGDDQFFALKAHLSS